MPLVAHAEEQSRNQSRSRDIAVPIIRISLGTFDPDKAALIEAKLIESKAALDAGIRGMRGNLGYYAGIDRSRRQNK
jgi:hypothetical protein